jgi:hypothetical protein
LYNFRARGGIEISETVQQRAGGAKARLSHLHRIMDYARHLFDERRNGRSDSI